MKTRTKLLGAGVAVAALAIGTYAFTASSQESGHGFGPHAMRHGMGRMMGQGMMGQGMMGPGSMGRGMMGHRGNPATREQVGDIHALLSNHDSIKRTVTNLSDGIRTVTWSDDPKIAQIIKTHVADMMRRVEAGDNADLPMQTSRLHAIFRNKDKIRTTVETTENGAVVVQTSDDRQTVEALQAHASDVTKLVRGGMAAMHEAMMADADGRMPGGMMGRGTMGHGMMNGPR